jgi:thiamine transport system substrate-binding protein
VRRLAALLLTAAVLGSCGDDDDTAKIGETGVTTAPASDTAVDTTESPSARAEITLVTYDSFPEEETSLNEALAEFSDETGITVEVLVAGDTGTMVSKAVLTAGNPEGDVMWGVDNTFLSRAIDADVFEPYSSPEAAGVPAELTALVPNGEATPIDYGDVCVNYDIAWFEEQGLPPPETFDDLLAPEYADLLVVENPATSSPGLAFLLATIATYGVDGWQEYWSSLAGNGVEVVDGWTEAYYERFSWAGGGPRPLVVSYGSSPPAEVLSADPPIEEAPTAIMESTCFRQVEFAGVLRGTDAPDEARALVDFLVSERFQSEIPLNLFVYPANPAVELPPEFTDYSVIPDDPLTIDPDTIDENRSAWIDEWTTIVLT